jgi:hypothetical protein
MTSPGRASHSMLQDAPSTPLHQLRQLLVEEAPLMACEELILWQENKAHVVFLHRTVMMY